MAANEKHDNDLPIIAQHMATLGFDWCHVNPRDGRRGQQPDLWSMATKGMDEAWQDREGKWQNVWPGLTCCSDRKRSPGDLRKEEDKDWWGKPRFGRILIYWMREGDEVRPEHVDESWGAGAALFDDHSFRLVLPPILCNPLAVRHDAEKALIYQMARSEGYRRVGQAFGVDTSKPAPAKGGTAAAPKLTADLHSRISDMLGEDGPTYSKGIVRRLGLNMTARALSDGLTHDIDHGFTKDISHDGQRPPQFERVEVAAQTQPSGEQTVC